MKLTDAVVSKITKLSINFNKIEISKFVFIILDNCPKSLTCENEGFVDMTCKCRCPDDIVGERCETVLKKEGN